MKEGRTVGGREEGGNEGTERRRGKISKDEKQGRKTMMVCRERLGR
jgi:hypothetical protein